MADEPAPSARGPGRPPVLSPDERRRAILSAAERVFTDRGYAATSMLDIARQAGMSKKTVYAIFATKRSLFDAFARDAEAFEQVLRPVEGLPLLDELRRSLRNALFFALSPRQILATRMLIAAGKDEQGLTVSFHGNVIAKAQLRHAELLAALFHEHGGHLDDPHLLAKQVFGFAMGDLHILALSGMPTEGFAEQVERQLDRTMDMIDALLVPGEGLTDRQGQGL